MKRCPKCSRVYADEALNFCLDDGEWLVPFEPGDAATAILSGDPLKEPHTRSHLTVTDPKAESDTVGISRRPRWRIFTVVAVTGVVVLIAAVLGIYKFAGSSTAAKKLSFESAKVTRLTNSGKVRNAAISPDGKYVVYVQDDGGQQSLWLRQTNTQSNVQIVPPAEVFYHGMTFTPDGDHIYYTIHEKADYVGELYEVPTLGGSPRKLLSDILSPVTFSPDGKQLAFVRQPAEEKRQQLMLADSEGGDQRVLTETKGSDDLSEAIANNLAWSPDGNFIAGISGNINNNAVTVVAIDIRTGEAKAITQRKWLEVNQISWVPDGSALLATATDEGIAPFQIWKVAFPSGDAERLTNDLSNYQIISVSRNADTLVTIPNEREENVWVTTVNDPAAHAAQITSGRNTIHGIAYAADGRIVYASSASGSMDIWITDTNGGNPKQLTANTRYNAAPFVTPDGRYILFWSDRTGAIRPWRMNIDGSNQTPLTDGNGDAPTTTPDSRLVYYINYEAGIGNVWRLPIEGGTPQRIVEKNSLYPVISRDGKTLACFYQDKPGVWGLAIFGVDGGAPLKIFSLPNESPTNLHFSPSGRSLVYGITGDGVDNLWEQPLDGSAPKQMTDFKSNNFRWFDFSPDGKQLAFSRGTSTKDAVLISNFR